jgi:methanogenic corrinoid protein MtbC1
MPLYTFSLEDGSLSASTTEPEELADDGAARELAEQVAREMAQGKAQDSRSYILVRNERGEDVCTVYLLGSGPSNVE